MGRTKWVGTLINGTYYDVTTDYNATTGRVEKTTYPMAAGVALEMYNSFNSNGYLEKVSSATGGTGTVFWKATAVNASGAVTAETYANGVTTTRLYDNQRGFITNIDTIGANSAVVQKLAYTYYGGVPNLKTRSDNLRSFNEKFTYDELNRLYDVTGSRTVSYCYDGLGNFSSKSDAGTVYNYVGYGPHAVSSVIGTVNGYVNPSYIYDLNGNQTSGAGRTMAYTSFNLPSSITKGTETQTFAYDAEHSRIQQVHNGDTTTYINPRWDVGAHYERESKAMAP